MKNAKALAQKAKEFGKIAFSNGLKCVPAMDKNMEAIYKEIPVTESAVRYLKAWHSGWSEANSNRVMRVLGKGNHVSDNA